MSARTFRAPDRVRRHASVGESVVHYDGPNGALCGWEGGTHNEYLGPGPVGCVACHEIVVLLFGLWHPRLPCPSSFGEDETTED